MRRISFGLVLAGWLVAAGLTGQPAMAGTAEEVAAGLPEPLLRAIRAGGPRFLRHADQIMKSTGATGEMGRDDVTRWEAASRARLRAKALSELMALDMDGDGRLTVEDQEALMPAMKHRGGQRMSAADRNQDLVVTLDEMMAWATRRAAAWSPAAAQQSGLPFSPADLLIFDVNGDDRVALDEIAAVVAAVPGPLAADERARRQGDSAACDLPPPPEGAIVVALGGYEASALTNVALDGQDRVTTVATLATEPGTAPLYVVAATHEDAILWKVLDDHRRIARFVVETRPDPKRLGPGVGVVGLPAEKVTFLPRGACMGQFHDLAGGDAARARSKLAASLGIDPEAIQQVGHYRILNVNIPSGLSPSVTGRGSVISSGTIFAPGRSAINSQSMIRGAPGISSRFAAEAEKEKPKVRNVERAPERFSRPGGGAGDTGFKRTPLRRVAPEPPDPPSAEAAGVPEPQFALWQRMRRLYRGGFIEIDPATVVAPGPVERYEILPAHAGLIQLLDDGRMRQTSKRRFVLLKPIPRFPAGLSHASSMSLVLGKDVPLPAGDAGRLPVYSGKTQRCVAGGCRIGEKLK